MVENLYILTGQAEVLKVVNSGSFDQLNRLQGGLGSASVVVGQSALQRHVVVLGTAADEVAL